MKYICMFSLLLCVTMSNIAFAADKKIHSLNKVQIPGHGFLTSMGVENGFMAGFSSAKGKTTCSGSCNGQSVGSWTCPEGKSCSLDCTKNPPAKSCH